VRGSHGHPENGVRAEPALGRRAVEIDHRFIEHALIELAAGNGLGKLAVHVRDGLEHAFAEVALLITVAQFERLALAGRRA
jgi:hypothetical protein